MMGDLKKKRRYIVTFLKERLCAEFIYCVILTISVYKLSVNYCQE
jgi:hypothetical protein